MTHIYFLLDSSGSMTSRISMVVSSVNEFLQEQKEGKEECFVDLYTFSRQVKTVFQNTLIENVEFTEKDYVPVGTTALWDAMGFVLQSIPVDSDKKQILIIVTDGEENSSLGYNPLSLKDLMKKYENKLEVVYIGSNQDAILNGSWLGVKRDSSLEYSDEKLPEAIRATSKAVKRYRENTTPTVLFTHQERSVTK